MFGMKKDKTIQEESQMNIDIKKHLDKLGKKAIDRITGFEGVVTSVGFDLYGCIQAVLTPPANESEMKSGIWLDINRLSIIDDVVVLEPPNFFISSPVSQGKKGCENKPLM